MARWLRRFPWPMRGGVVDQTKRCPSGGTARRFVVSALAATACLAGITSPPSATLDAAEAVHPAELVSSRQCDRCGFGSMRLETSQRHRSVAVGFLTDAELAGISALLRVAGRNVADPWLRFAVRARSQHGGAVVHEESAGSGEGDEPRLMSETAAAMLEAMTKGGGHAAEGSSLTLDPSFLQLLSVDEAGWVSLRLTTPQFDFPTIYSP